MGMGSTFSYSPLSRNITPLFKARGQFIWSGQIGEIKGSIWSKWDAAYFNFNFDGFNDSDLFWFSSDFRSFAVRTRQARNLLTAAYQGNITLVKDFLDAGADVNGKDEEGYTVLIMAAKNGGHKQEKLINQYKIVQLLVDKGADVNAKQKDGHTALKYARRHDLAQVIKILKQNGAEE
jgi:ankyrin repeat protein